MPSLPDPLKGSWQGTVLGWPSLSMPFWPGTHHVVVVVQAHAGLFQAWIAVEGSVGAAAGQAANWPALAANSQTVTGLEWTGLAKCNVGGRQHH